MPELVFKGKEFVYNHHLAVPHRSLVPDAEKSVGAARHSVRPGADVGLDDTAT